jgi:type IV pilus assembly protein PilW
MVGLSIGLLVTLSGLGSLVQSRLAASAVSESTRLQQDASTAMRVLGQQIRQAGALGLMDAAGGTVVFRQDTSDDPNRPLGVSGTESGSLRTDTLTVSHAVDPALDARDCLGQTAAGTVVRSSFRVVGQELQCQGSAFKATYQGLVTGVEDFQVWYGVRQEDSLQYREASAVTDWAAVVSVQICLVLVGEQRAHPVSARQTAGCGGAPLARGDGRLRGVFRQVFTLRHRGA